LLAAAAIIAYALASAAMVALIEPVFQEVLLAGGRPATTAETLAPSAAAPAAPSPAIERHAVDLKRHLDQWYRSL
jgi:hypothetical protein